MRSALLSAGIAGLWDEELRGFGVESSSSGVASYVVQYRMGDRESKTRRYTMTPATARVEAERLLRLVVQGSDPVEADRQRRREAVDLAFANYADRFCRSCKGKDGRGWSNARFVFM